MNEMGEFRDSAAGKRLAGGGSGWIPLFHGLLQQFGEILAGPGFAQLGALFHLLQFLEVAAHLGQAIVDLLVQPGQADVELVRKRGVFHIRIVVLHPCGRTGARLRKPKRW